MQSFLLQDYITIRGAASVGSVVQGEPGWLDLAGFQDVVFWLETKEITGTTPTMNYQTSPTRDENSFVTLASITMALGVAVTPILKDSATTPLARWVRFAVGGPGTAWDVTFRIWAAGNRVGRTR